MFRSLRFRLPALFLAGVALAGLVTSLIAIRLFQDYTREQSLAELKREARGLARLYETRAGAVPVSHKSLERATGDRIFYSGAPIDLAGKDSRESLNLVPRLPTSALPIDPIRIQKLTTFEFTPPEGSRTYLAAAEPVELGFGRQRYQFGSLIVAKPKAELRSRWVTLFERLAIAFLGGVLVSGALGLYLSRRISAPVRSLADAADRVAEGRYDVALPDVPAGDEIAHLAERFRQMAVRLAETDELERNFLMSVSHELRTPLTAIRGHVEALREGVVEDPDLRAESLDVIAAEAARLERLVGDILDLAKLNAHRFTVMKEEVDMERLCDRAYQSFNEEARRRAIDYRHDVEAHPVIVSDGDRVLQIISNLLSNAFRWTPDGGSIDLTLAQSNGAVRVAVEDSGPGIKPEDEERIFRPFVSRDGSGTGLGLPIARELATALGGRIDLTSRPGEGSRFELVLPSG